MTKPATQLECAAGLGSAFSLRCLETQGLYVEAARSNRKPRLAACVGARKGDGPHDGETSAGARGYAGTVARETYADATPGECKAQASLVKEGSTVAAGMLVTGLRDDGGSVRSRRCEMASLIAGLSRSMSGQLWLTIRSSSLGR